MKILIISHDVFLSKEERYDLYNGKEIEVVGVSVPVWVDEGKTSEPAVEVFCKYYFFNKQEQIAIQPVKTGYNIVIPKTAISQELPANLSPQEVEVLYNEVLPCVRDLLEIKDGGKAWIAFRQLNRLKEGDKITDILHYVEIKPIEYLLDSINTI